MTKALVAERGIRVGPFATRTKAHNWRLRCYYRVSRANKAAQKAGMADSEYSVLELALEEAEDGQTCVVISIPPELKMEEL